MGCIHARGISVGEYLVTLKEHASTCSGTVYLKGQAVFSCEDAKNRGELLGRLAEEAFSASSDAYSLGLGILAGTASENNFLRK